MSVDIIGFESAYEVAKNDNGNFKISCSLFVEVADILVSVMAERDALREEHESWKSAWATRENLMSLDPELQRMQGELFKNNNYNLELHKENASLREELRKAREQEPAIRFNSIGGGMQINPNYKGELCGYFYSSPVPAQKNELLSSTFALWWSMIEAEHELSENPIKDDQIILNYMGCGASCHVTAGDIRKILSLELKP